jgi:protein TonB
LLVHLVLAVLVLVVFGRQIVSPVPREPLVAEFVPLPTDPPPESTVEKARLPEQISALRESAPTVARPAGPAYAAASAAPVRPMSPIPSLDVVPIGPGLAGLAPDGLGDGTPGRSGSGVGSGDNSGAGTDAGPRRLAAAEWIERMTSAQMRPYLPRRAAARGIDGRAWLACQVTRSHRAKNCRLLAETPRDEGFGYAALRMSRLFRIRPPAVDGEPQYDAWVRIPVVFDVQ